jgi:hypothetical protein
MILDEEIVVNEVKELYQREGLLVKKAPAGFYLDGFDFGETVDIGDIKAFLMIAQRQTISSIFIIGNGWGWSTFCLATVFPGAIIDVIDAQNEGNDCVFGSDITLQIASKNNIKVDLTIGLSPQDTQVAAKHKNTPYELVLIDGRHGEMQMVEDFVSSVPFTNKERCVYVFHSVGKSNLLRSYSLIKRIAKQRGYNFFIQNLSFSETGTAIAAKNMVFTPNIITDFKVEVGLL